MPPRSGRRRLAVNPRGNSMESFVNGEFEHLSDEVAAQVDPGHYWRFVLLRLAMDLYVMEEYRPLPLGSFLREVALSVFGVDDWVDGLNQVKAVARTGAADIDRLSWNEANDERRDETPDKYDVLIACTLVHLALLDASLSKQETEYLHWVFKRLVPFEPTDVQDWLTGQLAPDRYVIFDSPLAEWDHSDDVFARRLAARLRGSSEQHREAQDLSADSMEDLLSEALSFLDEVDERAEKLGDSYASQIERTRVAIRALNRTRIAVVGEFKRGKSTLINALLGKAGLMPTHTLPSTSAIIEVMKGDEESYAQLVDLDERVFGLKSRTVFLEEAGDANERSLNAAEGRVPEDRGVAHWRVTLPEIHLDTGEEVILVDTPGLNEDPIRDALAVREARSAHAAVLTLAADQLLSDYERGLVERMSSKIRGLLVVINRADQVRAHEHTALTQRVYRLLKPYGLREEQVMLFDAKTAEEALRRGTHTEELRALRQRILDMATASVAPIKRSMLFNHLRSLRDAIEDKVQRQKRLLEKEAAELQAIERKRKEQREHCEHQITTVRKNIEQRGDQVADELVKLFHRDWSDEILAKVRDQKGTWKSDHNPIFSPKKTGQDIAKQAEAELVEEVRIWVEEKVQEQVEPAMFDELEQNRARIQDIAEYIEILGGPGKDKLAENLQNDLTGRLTDLPTDLDGGRLGLAYALAAVVSVTLGYVVSDIILYYVLSVISGFLNPFLLAAAAVLAIGAYLWKGKDYVRKKIQDNVADQILKKLSDEKTIEKLSGGLYRETRKAFHKVAKEFADLTKTYVNEAETSWEEVQELAGASDKKKETHRKQAEAILSALSSLDTLLPRSLRRAA